MFVPVGREDAGYAFRTDQQDCSDRHAQGKAILKAALCSGACCLDIALPQAISHEATGSNCHRVHEKGQKEPGLQRDLHAHRSIGSFSSLGSLDKLLSMKFPGMKYPGIATCQDTLSHRRIADRAARAPQFTASWC